MYVFLLCSDLIAATNETNVNIPQLADTLFERATNASWIVVFKALTTTHHICIYGNEVSCRIQLYCFYMKLLLNIHSAVKMKCYNIKKLFLHASVRFMIKAYSINV